MACGVLSNGVLKKDLRLRKANLPLMEELAEAFQYFEVEEAELKYLEYSLSRQSPAQRLPGFVDIMGMWSSWILVQGSRLNTVDNPFSIPVVTMGERAEARVLWRWLLKQHQSTLSDQRKRILQIYDDWEKSEPRRFYEDYVVMGNMFQDEEMMTYFKRIFDEAETYLTSPPMSSTLATKLIQKHLRLNVYSIRQAEKDELKHPNHRWQPQCDVPGPSSGNWYQGDAMFKERAFIYANNVSKVVEEMEKSDGLEPSQRPNYEDAWWMLMLRMQAWTMSIKMVTREGVKVPSHYYNNRTKVYIL
ncbi:Nn.00g069520.m01.CDS01 [Neocucurbitaria sp. VM-36]